MNEENRNRVITPREYSVLVERDEARTAKWLLFGILGILTAFVLWAFFAEMETLTRASGKVIPSSKVKIVQHFEGGIVYDIFAEEGELVDVGQPIITIDNTKAESEMESVELRYKYGRGQVARLQALIELAGGDLNAEPKFPIDLETDIVFQENIAFSSAKAEFEANIFEFEKKLDQRRQQKSSAYQELDLRRQQIALLDGTIQTYENLKGAGAVSRLDMDDKRSQLIETKLTVSALQSKLPILDSESKELQAQRKKYIEAFRYDAVQKLNEAKQDVYSSQALMRDRAGALSRTEILSPIAGIINQLYVTAPGEVIKPGGQVAEIVPIEDKFIAEVLIPPSEIGFLKIGQTAKIKVSAYDSARYGSLVGTITNISSDTIENKEQKNQEFYRVRASTDQVLQDRDGNDLTITAGMTVTVDIITGKRTVGEFLLLPIMRGFEGSLRQR